MERNRSGCDKLEILRIAPKDIINNKSLFYHKEGIKMNKKLYFEWHFDNNLLTKIKLDFIDNSSMPQMEIG